MASKQPRGVPKYPCLLDDVQRWGDISEGHPRTSYLMNRLQTTAPVALGLLGSVIAGGEAQSAVVGWTANVVMAVDIDGCYINVETQTASNGPGTGVPGWDVNPYSSASGFNFFNSTGGGQMRYPGVTTGPAGNLPLGTTVGSTGSYNTSTTGVVFGSAAGNWSFNATNYIGFRFVAAAGTTHYGWASFAVGATADAQGRTFIAAGWESTPNTPITVGAGLSKTPVPETSTVAAGALAGLAVGARFVLQRRRRATAQQACSVEA